MEGGASRSTMSLSLSSDRQCLRWPQLAVGAAIPPPFHLACSPHTARFPALCFCPEGHPIVPLAPQPAIPAPAFSRSPNLQASPPTCLSAVVTAFSCASGTSKRRLHADRPPPILGHLHQRQPSAMYKRDFGILLLSVCALYLSLQHEGAYQFKKAWCAAARPPAAASRLGSAAACCMRAPWCCCREAQPARSPAARLAGAVAAIQVCCTDASAAAGCRAPPLLAPRFSELQQPTDQLTVPRHHRTAWLYCLQVPLLLRPRARPA